MGSSAPKKYQDVNPKETPVTPQFQPHNNDHSWTLQAIMEMQKSIGSMEASVKTLAINLESQNKTFSELKEKITKVERTLYASGVVLLIALGVGGWLLNAAKDFALTQYKISAEAQAKPPQTPPPPKQ